MLGDDIAWALPQFRAEAESNMKDECTITRAGTGTGPFNETTGQYDAPARVTVYSGKCQFQTSGLLSSNSPTTAGERQGVVQATIVKLPFSEPTAGDVGAEQVVEIITCLENPELVGRKPTIVGKVPLKSQATARRFILNEVGA